jgi:hypothetical protein
MTHLWEDHHYCDLDFFLFFNSNVYNAGIGTANLQYQHCRRPMPVLQISRANTGIVDVTIKQQHLRNS